MKNSKIKDHHLEKIAYVYLRQSTMKQVVHHHESTERQYGLTKRAQDLGWTDDKIRILDADLGLSGTQAIHREDFKTLVADVSMHRVGAIFALEVSRLSRSNTDWHRLLELCALTNTLIIDEDGCYDPKEFNDQLLLGLKGTMSQAELHFLRARLQGGKLHKAKKGELRIPVPIGFSCDKKGHIILDRSKEVRTAVNLVFSTFKKKGSAYGVVQWFRENNRKFPKRICGGKSEGKLTWGHLYYARVLSLLKNPAYAGNYVYGRHQHVKIISPEGNIKSKKQILTMEHWKVNIKGHHPSYISWKDFIENQEVLEKNRTNGEGMLLGGAAREGLALLQGLLLCKICGRKLTVRYTGNNGIYPCYECLWRKKDGLSDDICILIRADIIDNVVAKRVLQAVQLPQIQKAVEKLEDFERINRGIDKQWRLRIERAESETKLAQKRYEEADPTNQLVVSTLESRWNDSLMNLEQMRVNYAKYKQKRTLTITPQQKQQILALAEDLPRIWNKRSTTAKERKRILRLMAKDITVEKIFEEKKILLHLRWQGGAYEDIAIDIPKKVYDRVRYSEETITRIRNLTPNFSDDQIAKKFNQQGFKSAKNKPFTAAMIRWIKKTYSICPKKHKNEFTVKELAEKFNISTHVVYYWIKVGYLKPDRLRKGTSYWFEIDNHLENKLYQWIKNSSKISS